MISVVIPTLNAERHLPRCFDSLIIAAVRGVVREVIVADGGSSDGSAESTGRNRSYRTVPTRGSQEKSLYTRCIVERS